MHEPPPRAVKVHVVQAGASEGQTVIIKKVGHDLAPGLARCVRVIRDTRGYPRLNIALAPGDSDTADLERFRECASFNLLP